MKSFWLKYNLIFIVLIFLGIISAGSFFLITPRIEKITIISDRIQEKIIEQEIESKRLSGLPEMEKNWLDFEAKKDYLEVVISSENQIEFIRGIEEIAEKTGNIISLKIGDSPDPKEIAKIKKAGNKKNEEEKGILDEVNYGNYFPIQINLKGDYGGLYRFINMLENNQFYVNVIIMEIKKETIDSKESDRDIFSKEEDQNLNKKEILNTNINAIVYTKN